MNWDNVINKFKESKKFVTDVELSNHFDVSRQMIFQIRKGDRKPAVRMVLEILDQLEYPITLDLALSLLSQPMADGLRARMGRQ